MKFILSDALESSVIYALIWAGVLVLATVAFIVMVYFASRWGKVNKVYEIYKDEKKTKKKLNYRKVNKTVLIASLKIKKAHPEIEVLSIHSDADIKEGTTSAFIMPGGEVTIYYGPRRKEEEIAPIKNYKKVLLPVADGIYKKNEEEVKPVLLLSTDDVISHIEKSNADYLIYPIINHYRYSFSLQKEVVVCYVGEAIYAVVICSEAVFKCLFRCDVGYAKDQLSDIDTLAYLKDDIYSIVLDSSFRTLSRFMDIFDHSYQYSLLTAYSIEKGAYNLKDDMVEASNSLILSYNERISLEFDPVYDKAIQEARRYKEKLIRIHEKEKALDDDMFSPKQSVYEKLESSNDLSLPLLDKYERSLEEITDGPYIEKKERIYVPRVRKVPTIEEELNKDVRPYLPSPLKITNFIDYVMSRKDMTSLTIDVSTSMKKRPTTMRFLKDKYFALLYKGRKAYVINFKFDLEKVRAIKNRHPHISHVKNGNEEDWFMFILDSTYVSYEELYDIAMMSYEYTKDEYYKKQELNKQ